MTAHDLREERYNLKVDEGYRQIMALAKKCSLPYKGNGKQYVDFTVGRIDVSEKGVEIPVDKVCRIRVLIDFRGEYFSSFIVFGKIIPERITSPIMNALHFSAQEAFDSIMDKVKLLNN